MGTHLLEVDGASLTEFGGGSANFDTYRGPAFQIDDERGRFIALTAPQAASIAFSILRNLGLATDLGEILLLIETGNVATAADELAKMIRKTNGSEVARG